VAVDVRQVDEVCGDLIRFYEAAGAQVIVLSEYGIREVTTPVHLNRVLRQRGLIVVREELGHELLDPGASAAFAVADHQVAHVYVNDLSRLHEIRAAIDATPGVEQVLDVAAQRALQVNHQRSGDLIAVAKPDAWFTYYYWLDDRRAPDFARTVDIHRKPGYDPVELFLDPAIAMPGVTVGWKLAKKQLGFRTLLDVIPLDARLVRGSHGRRPGIDDRDTPILITSRTDLLPDAPIESVDVSGLILRHLTA
jgi:predicted AlkP superfamily pyrophosphatase or phosphodiesterase